jgi:hypothetical protein
MVPGLRYRRRTNGSSVLFTREVHPGMSPGLPDEAGSLPAFAGSPWPDLPRCGPDRCSGPHPPVPALPTRTVPDPAPGRAGDHHCMRGCAPDWERSISPPKRSSPPMAAGHQGAHLGSVRLGGGGMVADSSHKPRMTHLPHLSGMGPQTAGAVGGDARRRK